MDKKKTNINQGVEKKNRKRRINFNLMIFIILGFFISLMPFGVSEVFGESTESPEIVTRGATWDDVYNLETGEHTKSYFMGAVNIPNESGVYIPFEDYLDVSINNGLLFQREDRWGVTFRPFFVMNNDNIFYWSDIPSSIEKDPWKTEYRGKVKYGFDFNYVPDNIRDNIKYVVLERVDSFGLTWDEVSISNNAINVFDSGINRTIVFSHDDILKTYTIPLINKSMIVIGNLTDNFVSNNDGTWNISFDPTVEYNFTTEANIWAWEKNNVDDTAPPTNSNPPSANPTEITSNAPLDTSDDSYETTTLSTLANPSEGFQLFNVSIQETISDITLINWSWEGKGEFWAGGPYVTVYFYLWDTVDTEWDSCEPSTTSTSDVWKYCHNESITTYIDSSTSMITFLVYGHNQAGGVQLDILTDFVKLEVTYISPVYNLTITDPTTASPKSVSGGDNITITFDFTENDVNLTSGVTMENVTIGGTEAIVVSTPIVDYNATIDALGGYARFLLSSDATDVYGNVTSGVLGTSVGSATPVTWNIPNPPAANWLHFDGNDGWDSSADDTNINTYTNPNGDFFAVSVWFNASNISDVGNGHTLWSQGGGTNSISIYVTDDLGWDAVFCTAVESATPLIDYAYGNISENEIYHLGCIWDFTNGYVAMWLNGTLVYNDTSNDIGSSLDAHSGNIALANQDQDTDDHDGSPLTGFWEGQIGDLVYWGVGQDGAVVGANFTTIYNNGMSDPGGDQFGYVTDVGWQVNVTVPTDSFTGLQDLFLNVTYSGNTRNDTQVNAINYGIINTAPQISLIAPANNTINTTSTQPYFYFNVTDAENLTTDCTLWLDNATAFTAGNNASVNNATTTSIQSNTSLANDDYWWWINCSDGELTNISVKYNISIDIDTTSPTYSLNSTNTTIAGQSCNFSLQADDETALHPNGGYIFSTNNTGTWINSSLVSFTATPQNMSNTTTLNSTVGTVVAWCFYFNDTAGNMNVTSCEASNKFLLTTTDTILPTITQNVPVDLANLSSSPVVFNCSATDNLALANISLYANFTGVWLLNDTNTVIGTDNSTTFSNSLVSGDWLWACESCDSSNNCNVSGNRTFSLDVDMPTISNINCTSCNNSLGDLSEPYNTTGDLTPTFTFDTSENADAGISDTNSSFTTCSVTGGTSHTCHLPFNNILTFETDYVYINVTDDVGNSAYDEWQVFTASYPFFLDGTFILSEGAVVIKQCES